MRLNGEIDALTVMGISPVRFVVAPALFGLIISLPILVAVANVASFSGRRDLYPCGLGHPGSWRIGQIFCHFGRYGAFLWQGGYFFHSDFPYRDLHGPESVWRGRGSGPLYDLICCDMHCGELSLLILYLLWCCRFMMARATDKQTTKPKQPRHPVLDIINLVGGYEGTAVIKDCSMQVPKGEIVVIMGGSGSGKSTFLKHLIGLEKDE